MLQVTAMTNTELFAEIKQRFLQLEQVKELLESDDLIEIKTLSTDEILGTAERKDFPILAGKEIIQQAYFRTGAGQAFTSQPTNGTITVKQLAEMPLDSIKNQGVFTAGLNAVMNYLGLAKCCIHCRDNGPENCGKKAAAYLKEKYGDIKIALIGYQPCLFQNISENFTDMRITDLGDKVGTEKYGRVVEHGIDAMQDVCDWADLILCTGSTLTNGTITGFLNLNKPILFYGTTISGTAELMNLKRLCFADTNGL